ncbi:Carbohydrate esterase 4 protein [Pleurotus ostreatus]|uniref:Carbohydrate esterase 4 protein n=1 Tax=Pleurotus ostreatus TaxID=5322 RepID=A0A8H6ZPF8_PLEOS|nr:Carbohydrate esterase 4 protein [Pleurotus ostreatus]KAF7424024.1 Carbohydrate esterase 4 protein [Pleurotus ostreatus]
MFASLFVTVALALFGCVSAAPQKRALAQVYSKCTVPNTVALTFDDGPYVWLYDISKALIAAGGKGTFFFNGNNYGCIYDDANIKRVKYAYDKGHQVASHTWGHKDLTTLTWDQIHDEMWRVELALQRICGVQPAFMRPPFGNYNNLVREASSVRGQSLAIWDFDSGDSLGVSAQESKNRYDTVVRQHPSNILALNHETIVTTSQQVIPYAIQKLQAAGYRLVTLAECLGQQPYQWVGTPQTKDSSWTVLKARCAPSPFILDNLEHFGLRPCLFGTFAHLYINQTHIGLPLTSDIRFDLFAYLLRKVW